MYHGEALSPNSHANAIQNSNEFMSGMRTSQAHVIERIYKLHLYKVN